MAKRLGSDSTGDRQGPQAAPAAAWDFQSILAIADALPMPIAYLDTERRYRFVNKALADFFERPRSEILGATMAEVVGADVYAVRRPMLDAAFAGERQWFVADYDHPARGPLSIQAEYLPQHSPDGRVG